MALDLGIGIKVDPGSAVAQADKVTTALHRVEDQGARAGQVATGGLRQMSNEAKRTEGSFNSLARTMKQGLQVAGLGIAGHELFQLADGFQNIQNRLRFLAGGDLDKVNDLFGKLQGLASRTRADLTTTAEGFVKISMATKTLGLTQGETLQFTERLNKAIVLSGSTTAGAQAAMLQLSQGLSAGALRGEEFNSVIENAPMIIQTIATQLGVTTGQLRMMAFDGKLTADVIVDAFKRAGDSLDKDFGNTVPTVSQLVTQLKNNLMTNLGPSLQSATQLIMQFGDAIGNLNENLGGLKLGLGTVAGYLLGGPWGAAVGTAIESAGALADRYGRVTDSIKELMEEEERLRAGVVLGTVTYEDLIAAGFSVEDAYRLLSQAAKATSSDYRDAVERMRTVTKDMVTETTSALREWADSDDLARITKQMNDAAKAAQDLVLKRAIAMAEAQGLGPKDDLGEAIERNLNMAAKASEAQERRRRELTNEEKLLQRLHGEYDQANKDLVSLEILYARNKITAGEYANELERLTRVIGEFRLASSQGVTGGLGSITPMSVPGLDEIRMPTTDGGVDFEKLSDNLRVARQGIDEMNAAWQRIETDRVREQFESLGQTLRPVADSLIDMFREGEFSARRLEKVLQDVAIQLIRMAALRGIAGAVSGGTMGIGTGSFLTGLLGGGRNGFDYMASSAALQLPGFARGGSMTVSGSGSQDSHLLMARVSPGESVHVRTPQQRMAEDEWMRSMALAAGAGRGGVSRTTVVVQNDPREIVAGIGSYSGQRELVKINRKLDRRR